MSETGIHQEAEATEDLPALILEPEWLVANLDRPELRILDVRAGDAFVQGHILHARHLPLERITAQVDGVQGMLVPSHAYARVMGSLGIQGDTPVVIYDDHWGMAAARVLWSLAHHGHHRAAVLNGGWDRWQEEGHPTDQDQSVPEGVNFELRRSEGHTADRAWLLAHGDEPDVVLLDTRTVAEYARGHLPRAVNWDWMNGVPVGKWDAIRPVEELRAELAQAGVTPEKEVVTYCRSGVRAAHTYLLLRHLGFSRVRNYDGSWLEWSQYV